MIGPFHPYSRPIRFEYFVREEYVWDCIPERTARLGQV
jgi:hypothetical protein